MFVPGNVLTQSVVIIAKQPLTPVINLAKFEAKFPVSSVF